MRRTKTDTRNTNSHPSAAAGRARQRSVPGRGARRAKIFRIDKGKLQVCSLMEQKKVRSGGRESFVSERQLARLTASWPMARLVGIWNGLPGVKGTDRFIDRKTAVRLPTKNAFQSPPKRLCTTIAHGVRISRSRKD